MTVANLTIPNAGIPDITAEKAALKSWRFQKCWNEPSRVTAHQRTMERPPGGRRAPLTSTTRPSCLKGLGGVVVVSSWLTRRDRRAFVSALHAISGEAPSRVVNGPDPKGIKSIVVNNGSRPVWRDRTKNRNSKRISDMLADANGACSWAAVRAQYEQYRNLLGGTPDYHLLRDLRGHLSASLSRMSASYSDRPERMAEHAFAVLADVDQLEVLTGDTFSRLYHDTPADPSVDAQLLQGGPTLFEATVETSRRFRDANAIRQALCSTKTSGILCGSSSYGGYFSVRGNRSSHTASDLDILIVYTKRSTLQRLCTRLKSITGINRQDVKWFGTRARIFLSRYNDGQTTLSHKFKMWSHAGSDPAINAPGISPSYILSLHVLPLPVLEYVLAEACPELSKQTGTFRVVRDYRCTDNRREDHIRAFTGQSYLLPPGIEVAEGGFIRRTSAYIIHDDHYYPGLYQTIAQPTPHLLWDSINVARAYQRHAVKLINRLRSEESQHPLMDLRLSYAHVRRERFAPHVIEEMDRRRLN